MTGKGNDVAARGDGRPDGAGGTGAADVSSTSTVPDSQSRPGAHRHRPQPVQHRPRCLVGADLQRALQAQRGDAVLLRGEHPAGGEPHRQRRPPAVEQRACRHRGPLAAGCALVPATGSRHRSRTRPGTPQRTSGRARPRGAWARARPWTQASPVRWIPPYRDNWVRRPPGGSTDPGSPAPEVPLLGRISPGLPGLLPPAPRPTFVVHRGPQPL
jgi:hypothetical protein